MIEFEHKPYKILQIAYVTTLNFDPDYIGWIFFWQMFSLLYYNRSPIAILLINFIFIQLKFLVNYDLCIYRNLNFISHFVTFPIFFSLLSIFFLLLSTFFLLLSAFFLLLSIFFLLLSTFFLLLSIFLLLLSIFFLLLSTFFLLLSIFFLLLSIFFLLLSIFS